MTLARQGMCAMGRILARQGLCAQKDRGEEEGSAVARLHPVAVLVQLRAPSVRPSQDTRGVEVTDPGQCLRDRLVRAWLEGMREVEVAPYRRGLVQ